VPAQCSVADGGKGEHRRHEVRAAALVLARLVDSIRAVLPSSDHLVLGAVVGGDAPVAQRDERRHQPGQADCELARERPAARAAQARAEHGSGKGCRERAGVEKRQPRLGQGAPHGGDDRHRLGEAGDAAQTGKRAERSACENGLASRAHDDAAVACSHRCRPARRPVQ
jgi:hypothetical protein